MRLALIACLGLVLPAHAERSKAAAWLMAAAVVESCDNGGTFDPERAVETDLTGDGANDLILSFAGLSCDEQVGANDFCGASGMCSVRLYVRQGDETLALYGDYLSQGGSFRIQESMPPGIVFTGHDGVPETLHWRGTSFE